MTCPPNLDEPPFEPKCPELPVLDSYRGSFPQSYWDLWPKKELNSTPAPWISPTKLKSVALSMGYPHMEAVNKVADSLAAGVGNGARGAGRLNAQGRNLTSFFEHGRKALDALCDWVHKGLMAGPFKRYLKLDVLNRSYASKKLGLHLMTNKNYS